MAPMSASASLVQVNDTYPLQEHRKDRGYESDQHDCIARPRSDMPG